MRRRGIASVLASALVVASVASAFPADGDTSRAAEVGPTPGVGLTSTPRAFSLGLGAPSGNPAGFSLGLTGSGDQRYRFDQVDVTGLAGPPLLAGLATWSIGSTFNIGMAEGRPRILLLGPLQREWEDLDGWEKFGVVLQTAAAAAAAVHFTGKLIEKLK